MAFHTIWSVDVGKSSLKAAKLRRDRNNIEILAVDKVDYPISKNGVDAVAQAKEALAIFRARNEVREPVVAAHPGQGTFYRSIKVPASDERKVESMVGYEASQQIPFPLDEVIWDYHVIDKEYLPGEEREVALFAVRREAMDDFLVDFANENLAVEKVSIGYLGLLNFIRHDIHPEEPSIVLDIGAAHTDLVLVDDSRFWIRPLPHSGTEMTRAIMARFKLGYAEAEKLKVESSKVPKQAVKIFQTVIQPKLKELVGEIHRSIGYYRSQAGDVTFKHLYLLGNGSKIVGIKKFLEEQLGVRVTRVQSISRFRVNRGVNLRLLQADLPSFATSLGCGLQGLEAAACQVDLVPREEKLKKELGRKKKHAFVAAGLLLAIMIVAHFLLARKIEDSVPVTSNASDLVAELQGYQRAFNAVEQGDEREGELGLTDLRRLRSTLSEIAEVRPLVLEGFGALESVLERFPNKRRIVVVEPESKDEDSRAAIEKFRKKQALEHLWVPYVKVESIRYPEGTDSKDKTPTVPAYRFTAFPVIAWRVDNETSAEFIRERFVKPLEEEIKLQDISTDPKVHLQPGTTVPAIYYDSQRGAVDPGSSVSRRPGAEEPEEPKEEGLEYYGAPVTWLLVPRHPPPPEEEPEEDEDEDRRPRSRSRGRTS